MQWQAPSNACFPHRNGCGVKLAQIMKDSLRAFSNAKGLIQTETLNINGEVIFSKSN